MQEVNMFERILYPTDFSDVSKKALEYCKKLKEAGTKKVIVLHVIELDPNIEKIPTNIKEVLKKELEQTAHKEIEAIATELREKGFDVSVRIELGNPVKEILRVEGEENASAIVLGSHGKSNIKEILIGSVSENVIRKSRVPVLVVKR
jgi:nucleotide-binding universal stress UspA family protein